MTKKHSAKYRGLREAAKKRKHAASLRRMHVAYNCRDEVTELLPQECQDLRPASAKALLEVLELSNGATLVVLGCGSAVEYVSGLVQLGKRMLHVHLLDISEPAIASAARLLLSTGAEQRRDGTFVLSAPEASTRLRGCTVTFSLRVCDLTKMTALPPATTHVWSTAIVNRAMTRHIVHLAALPGRDRPIQLALFAPRFRDVHLHGAVSASVAVHLCGSAEQRTVGVVTLAPRPFPPAVGTAVRARFDGRAFYDGRLRRVNADGTLVVDFDDGDVDENIKCFEWQLL